MSPSAKGPAGSSAAKDTIYVDVEDEITSIIDKVNASSGKVVALVLPKRASVFQSIVNMKLLQRSAEQSKKNVVLITSEAALMPLAASVGLYVASTPTSKPEIPIVASAADASEEAIDMNDGSDDDVDLAGNAATPIGQLAGGAGAAAAADGIETVELDNDDDAEDTAAATGVAATKTPKVKKDKKLKVPNFNKFRVLIFVGILAVVLLIFGLYVCAAILPKATITIGTNASDVNSNLTITLDTKATSLDPTQLVAPAKVEQEQKSVSQQVAATGKKNNGQKATGQVQITNCTTDNSDIEIPAGTGVSSNGLTYILQDSVSLPFSGHRSNGSCQSASGITSATADATAQTGGSNYNISSGATFTVAGYSTSVTAKGASAFTGGTDEVITVVQQSDIDSATQKLATQDTSTVKDDLQKKLTQDGLYAVMVTFDAGTPSTSSSSQVGDQANNVTVTSVYTYTMYGTAKSNLDTFLKNDIKSQVDTSKQSILTDGLDKASFKVASSGDTSKQLSLQATGTVGPDLHSDQIAANAAGKKPGEVKSDIGNLPGVTTVDVKTSPFWVSSVPKKTSKITVVIEKASAVKQ